MRIIKEATTVSKNPTRRVTVSGKEEVQSKRARSRRTAAGGVTPDDDIEIQLSWKRKTGGLQVVQSRYRKTVAPSGVFGTSSGTVSEDRESGPYSAIRFRRSVPPGGPVVPLQEGTQLDLDLPSDVNSEMSNGNQHTMAANTPDSAVNLPESAELSTGLAPETSAPPPPPPPPPPELPLRELGDGDLSPLTELSDEESNSDIPLSLVVFPSPRPKKQSFVAEQPQDGRKRKVKVVKDRGKGKAKVVSPDTGDATLAANDFGTEPQEPSGSTGKRRTKSKAIRRNSKAKGDLGPSYEGPDEEISEVDFPFSKARGLRSGPHGPRGKSAWRAIDPPSTRTRPTKCLPASSLRPRVWAGGKNELFAALPSLAKNDGGVVWEVLEYPTLVFSGARSESGLGWWEKDAWEGRKIIFSIVREVDVPLTLSDQHPTSIVHSSSINSESAAGNAHPPPITLSNFPGPILNFNSNGADPFSGSWNSEMMGLPSGPCEAGPSRITLEDLTGAPSRTASAMEEVSDIGGAGRSFPFVDLDLPHNHDNIMNTGDGHMSFSMSCGAKDRRYGDTTERRLDAINYPGQRPGGCPSSAYSTAEAISVDDPRTIDAQVSFLHTHEDSSALSGPALACEAETQHILPGTRGSVHGFSHFASSSTWEPPAGRTPLDTSWRPSSEPTEPSSSELAHPPPNQTMSGLHEAPSYTPLDPPGSKGLHDSYPYALSLPRPPPEVSSLLRVQSSGDVVSPVFSRDSPLVPWVLPSEIGYFWLGLFKISEVKVDTNLRRRPSGDFVVRCTWRFSLEWVPGGEDLLMDEVQDDYHAWSMRITRPWMLRCQRWACTMTP
ncbi:hypothetical protein B0F90DRAFT_1283282 [Multifurca ochricompacta]|uniref:Uncharacterized protein n=1 Tax=Multifurca ochricompacta TaxID=376703 RepID=A0AAD4QKM0_9AGAM|nr:hypothetical protein B0F90DRAFT_1283282 [Multifurca ochricompacta]